MKERMDEREPGDLSLLPALSWGHSEVEWRLLVIKCVHTQPSEATDSDFETEEPVREGLGVPSCSSPGRG